MSTKKTQVVPKSMLVNADPAKGFFVSMLIKDITLRDAIGDLVDNAVDAIKGKADDPTDLSGYKIVVKLAKDHFIISDNGFGMEAGIARNTAFNFGKSDTHQLIEKSIGQFGIGMKRAFFKIGSNIHVQSVAAKSKFNLTISVPQWLKEPNNWKFEFDAGSLFENIHSDKNATGFFVKITGLSEDSILSFSDANFINTLQNEIALEHMLNINKGLKIEIAGFELLPTQITLVNDDNIQPTYWEKVENNKSVKILAGISNKDSEDGGWYIFCNDRLIVGKNKTSETVWTGAKGDGVPLWHAQYFRFRGYVFFEAEDSSNLPWNTTKTGMDKDSPYYKEVRGQMIIMTRQVMDLLDKLKGEKVKDNPADNQNLNKAVETSMSNTQPVLTILSKAKTLKNRFVYPAKLYNPAKKTNIVKIAYQVSNEKFEAVKQQLGTDSPKEIGLETFNYYYDNEI